MLLIIAYLVVQVDINPFSVTYAYLLLLLEGSHNEGLWLWPEIF
jgi:hypothetical protein